MGTRLSAISNVEKHRERQQTDEPNETGITRNPSRDYDADHACRPVRFGQNPTERQRIRAGQVLERLDLQAISDQPYGQLSDGQRRRLLMARALVHEPDVLVLDEPSRALDLKGCHQLMHTLSDLCRRGTTLVQVTHRIDTIIPEMKRVLFLQKGRIVGDGTPAEMLTSTKLSALYDTPVTVVEAHGFRQVFPA